jgi:hypothetical protein
LKKSLTIIDEKKQIKKSVSSIFPKLEIKKEMIDMESSNENNNNYNNNNEANTTIQSNTIINNTTLFNKDIKFTTINEIDNINFLKKKENKPFKKYKKYKTIVNNDRYPLINDFHSQQKILSENFANIIKMNDFTPNLGKYDKKIIIALNQKCKEIENKYIKSLKYYYQMENLYINEEKKKKDSEFKLKNSLLEANMIKNRFNRMKQDNIHLNNALVNARNEIDRLNIAIKNDHIEMVKKQDEYNNQLKIEENKRNKLRNVIKINEKQISILQEKINDSSLSNTMKMKRNIQLKKTMKGVDEIDGNEQEKDDEIIRLKNIIEDLQRQSNDLEKNLKRDKEKKRELMETIKYKDRLHRFNNDNINLLFKTIERQEEYNKMNYNLVKSKNIIIKDMKDKISGINNVPHYSLPKNNKSNST